VRILQRERQTRAHCFLVHTGRSGTLGRIDRLDIFTLGQGPLVATQTTLGKFVNALVGTGTTRLDHVENAAFVRCQTDDFAGNGTAECDASAQFLQVIEYIER
jgi:hypothetical protein